MKTFNKFKNQLNESISSEIVKISGKTFIVKVGESDYKKDADKAVYTALKPQLKGGFALTSMKIDSKTTKYPESILTISGTWTKSSDKPVTESSTDISKMFAVGQNYLDSLDLMDKTIKSLEGTVKSIGMYKNQNTLPTINKILELFLKLKSIVDVAKRTKVGPDFTKKTVPEFSKTANELLSLYDKLHSMFESKNLKESFGLEATQKLAKEISKYTQNNDHGEARLTLAKALSLSKFVKIYTAINTIHELERSLPYNLSLYRSEVDKEMMKFAKSKFSPEEFKLIEDSL